MTFNSGSFITFTKNNLAPGNIRAFSNASGMKMKITNIWWGMTIASNIQKKICGQTGYSNFTPYRLWGPFDITPYADTDPPQRVAYLRLSLVSQSTVNLKWNKNTSPDFVRYHVYRSPVPGTTNLDKSCVITNIYNVSGTNINNCPGSGTWYYTITALDSKVNYTNECWYSFVTNAVIPVTTTAFSLHKSVSNILLNGVPSNPVPGAMIIYKIVYSNIGGTSGNNVILYDKLPAMSVFSLKEFPQP